MARGFKVTLWRPPEQAPLDVWAARVLGVLKALRDDGGVGAVVRYDDRRVAHEVALDHAAIVELIDGRDPHRDAVGKPMPRLGKSLDLIGVRAADDPEGSLCRVSLGVLISAERVKNTCLVRFERGVAPEAAYRAFPGCVGSWSPDWGCVGTGANADVRYGLDYAGEEPSPVDQMLHWRTYFGPERARGLDFEAIEGRDGVVVRGLGEGVEVILGERWESDEALLKRQRELEPLLFARAWTGPV